MMALVSSDELAKDVTGAEALLERHQVGRGLYCGFIIEAIALEKTLFLPPKIPTIFVTSFQENILFWCSLEASRRDASNELSQHMF